TRSSKVISRQGAATGGATARKRRPNAADRRGGGMKCWNLDSYRGMRPASTAERLCYGFSHAASRPNPDRRRPGTGGARRRPPPRSARSLPRQATGRHPDRAAWLPPLRADRDEPSRQRGALGALLAGLEAALTLQTTPTFTLWIGGSASKRHS